MASVLTAKAVEAAKLDPNGRREVPDGGCRGLYLVIQSSGAKSWALRYRFGGKSQKLTIGHVLHVRLSDAPVGGPALGQGHTLSEARRAAERALAAVSEGVDPAKAKKAAIEAAKPVSEEALADKQAEAERDLVRTQGAAFVEGWCKAQKNRSWPEVERQFKAEINPVLGDRHVAHVTKRDVKDLLKAIVARGSPVTANRVFATLRKFFSWLVDEDVIAVSPCDGITKPTEETPRERVLTDPELQDVWRGMGAFEYPFGPMWRLLLLTGQRREEVAGIEWPELSLGGNWPEWKLPGSRTKNGKPHSVPLSHLVVAILGLLPREPIIAANGKKLEPKFAFTTTGETHVSGYSRSKARLDAEIGRLRTEANEAAEPMPPWGLHDLRRTVATRLAGFGVRLEVIEKILNHVSGSFAGIVGVYQKHDFEAEKRQALEAWTRYVELLVDERLWPKFQEWRVDGDREEETARSREFNAAILEGGPRWLSVLAAIRGDQDEVVLKLPLSRSRERFA